MLRIIDRAVLWLVFAVASVSVPVSGTQESTDPPPAPIPSQIITGKKVFISNASGENASAAAAPDLAYNEFYAALKSWGRYDLVAAPGDADLIFEIRYVIALGAVNVFSGNGSTVQDPEVILVIRDPKTHVLLWAFNESLHQEKKQTGRQAFDQALIKSAGRIVFLRVEEIDWIEPPTTMCGCTREKNLI